LAARKVREELDAMAARQVAVDGGDDALEPSAHTQAPVVSAEQEAAAAAAAAAAFANGVDSITAAVLADTNSRAAAPVAPSPAASSAVASSAAHASEKKEKQKLDKVKRAQERLQVTCDVCGV
jgi:hypothetical protein